MTSIIVSVTHKEQSYLKNYETCMDFTLERSCILFNIQGILSINT